ncbi:MAG: flagellar M-ring protein FliF [Burkholderiaceae bacterium]|nr:flagellar M-ring protein FliF [Burkholderiaceae bacterium]
MLRPLLTGLKLRARLGLGIGLLVIAAALTWAALTLLRPEQQTLFSELTPQDASAMSAELDRMKVPYRLGEDGASLIVDKSIVHQTRLKLMSKELPLHGAVGFELFNNNDFGMTEFAQKVNYQRALQGEITRTILSLTEIATARVHIAFADEGLFKRHQQQAKASVTVGLKRHRALKPAQVLGIQRLVSAAVTGITPTDVTVLDQQGVALTPDPLQEEAGRAGTRLEIQQEVERHLNQKVSDILAQAYGPGRYVSSVNVTLDMNQVRVTSEDVVGANAKGEPPAGIVVRERESLKDASTGVAGKDGAVTPPSSSVRDIEYQVGRRVEQVVRRPGSITRLQVLAVIKQGLQPAQLEQLRSLVGAAVGASAERGDSVIVQSLDMLGASAPRPEDLTATPLATEHSAPTDAPATPLSSAREPKPLAPSLIAMASLLAIGLLGGLVLHLRTLARSKRTPGALSTIEREQALLSIRRWMDEPRPLAEQHAEGST